MVSIEERNKFIEDNYQLIYGCIEKYLRRVYDRSNMFGNIINDDLLSLGHECLIRSADKYLNDPELHSKVKFSTVFYASFMWRMNRYFKRYNKKIGAEYSVDKYGPAVFENDGDNDVDRFERGLKYLTTVYGGCIEVDDGFVDNVIAHNDVRNIVKQTKLTKAEREYVNEYINSGDPNYCAVGEKFGTSRQYAKQVIDRAVKKMKNCANNKREEAHKNGSV